MPDRMVMAVDPVEYMINYLRKLFALGLPSFVGYSGVDKIKSGVTPTNLVLVETMSSDTVETAERVNLMLKVWSTDGDYDRRRTADVLVAHLRRDLRAIKTAGPTDLPDPANGERLITQVKVSILLRGVTQ